MQRSPGSELREKEPESKNVVDVLVVTEGNLLSRSRNGT